MKKVKNIGFFRKITSFVAASLLILLNFSYTVSATSLDNQTEITSPVNNLANYKSDLSNTEGLEMVSTTDSYFKYELKNKNVKKTEYEAEDFIVKEIDSDTFFEAKVRESNKLAPNALIISRAMDNYYENPNGGDSYLQLSLCVMRYYATPYKFVINHNYNWIKQPFFNFTDVIGISVGNTMKINANSYKTTSGATVSYPDPANPGQLAYKTQITSSNVIEHSSAGIATKFDMISGVDFQSGQISCDAEFTQPDIPGHQSANVFGNYIHTKFGFSGALSIDTVGKPSVAFNIVEKQHSYALDVTYDK